LNKENDSFHTVSVKETRLLANDDHSSMVLAEMDMMLTNQQYSTLYSKKEASSYDRSKNTR